MTTALAYLSTLLVFVAVDLAWLSAMASRLYRPTLGDIALAEVNLAPAAVFYLLFPVGLVFFAVMPALKAGGIGPAALNGAIFGGLAYATYDLTNQATLRNWTTQLSAIDIAWGMLLSAFAAAVGYFVASRLGA